MLTAHQELSEGCNEDARQPHNGALEATSGGTQIRAFHRFT
jgi:hypothetical protein